MHVPPLLAERPRPIGHALVLGDGDSMMTRELLSRKDIQSVIKVSPDKALTALARNILGSGSQRRALLDTRVQIISADILEVLESRRRLYDLIVADLPDPDTLDAVAALRTGVLQAGSAELGAGRRLRHPSHRTYYTERAGRSSSRWRACSPTRRPITSGCPRWVTGDSSSAGPDRCRWIVRARKIFRICGFCRAV